MSVLPKCKSVHHVQTVPSQPEERIESLGTDKLLAATRVLEIQSESTGRTARALNY